MLSDGDLEKFLDDNKQLVWNNYFEDIGEGRTYQGQWVKTSDFINPENHDRTTGSAKGAAPPEKVRWRGIGTIAFQDGSKYQG